VPRWWCFLLLEYTPPSVLPTHVWGALPLLCDCAAAQLLERIKQAQPGTGGAPPAAAQTLGASRRKPSRPKRSLQSAAPTAAARELPGGDGAPVPGFVPARLLKRASRRRGGAAALAARTATSSKFRRTATGRVVGVGSDGMGSDRAAPRVDAPPAAAASASEPTDLAASNLARLQRAVDEYVCAPPAIHASLWPISRAMLLARLVAQRYTPAFIARNKERVGKLKDTVVRVAVVMFDALVDGGMKYGTASDMMIKRVVLQQFTNASKQLMSVNVRLNLWTWRHPPVCVADPPPHVCVCVCVGTRRKS